MLKTRAKLPKATIATLENGEIQSHDIYDFLGEGTHVLVGVPGVFTPVCTKDHIPSLIAHASEIRAKGVDGIFCISDDNPWAVDVWAKSIPGHEAVTFLSDGNRDFLNKTDMRCDERELFLDGKYARFYAVIKDAMIVRVRFETSVLNTICTRGDCIISDIEDAVQ